MQYNDTLECEDEMGHLPVCILSGPPYKEDVATKFRLLW